VISHNATAVEPKWLVEVAPQFFKVADQNKISKRKKQEKIEPLFNKVCYSYLSFTACQADVAAQYEKPDEWRLSKVKRSARSVCDRSRVRSGVAMLNLFRRVKHLVDQVSNIWVFCIHVYQLDTIRFNHYY
jgi:hypothetical protein